MILLTLCVLLSAVALPSIPSLPVYFNRILSLSLLGALVLAANPASWKGVAHGVSAYSGLIEITYASVLAQILLYSLAIVALQP